MVIKLESIIFVLGISMYIAMPVALTEVGTTKAVEIDISTV